jgi:demethylmenaquinone methyltransferase/2-methoxy-6-polyprenyl-1,4-benzoquinol methylase
LSAANSREADEIARSREPQTIANIFARIAPWYDLANHCLSLGADLYWRRRAAQIIKTWNPPNIVDLATGTGDLALVLKKQLPAAEIVGVDFSEEMLAIARRKGLEQTVVGDISALPFGNDSFDCVTIAFGLRNVRDWAGGLREMARVLKGNGHLLVLEFSLPRFFILRAIYRFYLHRIMPAVAFLLTRRRDAYKYLGASIENFPAGESMVRLIAANGFKNVAGKPLSGGIVTIYAAEKAS